MRLLLVDTFGLLFRAYHAFPDPLVNSKGQETSVLFGFFGQLQKLFTERTFDRFACVLDAPGPSFREALDPNYKAHRPETPDPLKKQIAEVIRLLPSLGVPSPSAVGFEADDVIATLATRAEAEGWTVDIFSGDKDLAQLVTDRVHLIQVERKTGAFLDLGPAEVEAKWGVSPAHMVDYFALVGDASDNVPGVAGIGPKGAVKLVTEFGTVESMYERLAEVSPEGTRQKLALSRDSAHLSKKLVTVECAIPGLPDPSDLELAPVDRASVLQAFQDLEMFGLIKRFGLDRTVDFRLHDLPSKPSSGAKKTAAPPALSEKASQPDSSEFKAREIRPVVDFERRHLQLEDLPLFIEELRAAGKFIFDFETTSLDPAAARIVSIAFAWQPHRSAFLRLITRDRDDSAQALALLKPLFEDASVAKTCHHLKYEMSILAVQGIQLKGPLGDTLLSAYELDPGRGAKNLEALVLARFGVEKSDYAALVGKRELLDVEEAAVEIYALEDAEWTLRLEEDLNAALDTEGHRILETMDLPLVPVLGAMEAAGVLVDSDKLRSLSNQMAVELASLEMEAHRLAGRSFNLASPKQLQVVLFEDLKLNPGRKTKTGYSTDEETLQKLEKEHPLIPMLLRHRNLSKLKGTYLDALPQLIRADGRIHTSFHQHVAATGRLSSSDPNLQNIPVKTRESRLIRGAFVAPPGQRVVSFDYSQVELRLLARLAGEERLLRAFREGRDIHRETASLLFQVEADSVQDDQRRVAKTINFSVIYGISAFSLAAQLGISNAEAKRFIDGYFLSYPSVRSYMDQELEKARQNLWVETAYGRKRHLKELGSRNKNEVAGAERAAFNAVIQGTAADVIKLAMIRLHRQIQDGSLPATMVLQVHDELVFYVDEALVETAAAVIRPTMTGIEPFADLLEVDFESAPQWS